MEALILARFEKVALCLWMGRNIHRNHLARIEVQHCRGQGPSRLIMKRLMIRVWEIAPTGATIGFMAAAGKEGFYERIGFTARPTKPYRAGMMLLVEWECPVFCV